MRETISFSDAVRFHPSRVESLVRKLRISQSRYNLSKPEDLNWFYDFDRDSDGIPRDVKLGAKIGHWHGEQRLTDIPESVVEHLSAKIS